MRKTFLEMVEVFAAAILLTALLGLVTGAGLVGTILSICDNIILVTVVLMLDDVAFRANRYRQSMNKNYLVQMLFVLVAVVGFAAAKNADNVWQNYIGLLASLGGVAGAITWYIRVYSYDVSSPEELLDRVLRKNLKAFRKTEGISASDCEAALEGLCAHRFINDDPSSGFDFDRAFAAEPVAIVEMTDAVVQDEARRYLLQCMENWLNALALKKEKKNKKKSEE